MSTVHFFCVMCGAPLFRGAGSSRPLVECPKCSHVVPVPDEAGSEEGIPKVFPRGILSLEMIFLCGHCDCHIQIDARGEGQAVNCPRCTRETTVPRWSRREPEAVALSDAEVEFLTASMRADGHS
jgi:DNA-directed RNA polymerase subunit RPC12/RpoP